MAAPQNKNTEFCAPLTSFDWNETDPKRLGTSSIDTTCTIWDIEVGLAPCTMCTAACHGVQPITCPSLATWLLSLTAARRLQMQDTSVGQACMPRPCAVNLHVKQTGLRVQKGVVDTQLIAHDREVYDIAWGGGGAGVFASVSADGSVRVFDLRYSTLPQL